MNFYIRFYKKGILLAQDFLPEGSNTKERKSIARNLGIRRYDRFEFIDDNGNVRADSDLITPKSIFKKEFQSTGFRYPRKTKKRIKKYNKKLLSEYYGKG